MNKSMKRIFSVVIAVALTITLIPTSFSYGAVKSSVKSPTLVDTFETSNADGTDYVKIRTSGSNVTMEYKSTLPGVKYRMMLRRVGTTSSNVAKTDFNAESAFTKSLDTSYVSDGTYYLCLARAANSSQASGYEYIGGGHGYTFIGVPIKVTSGTAKICKYSDVLSYDQKIRKSGRSVSKSKDKTLSDISFVFNDPYSGKRSVGTTNSKMTAYFSKISKKVTSGATTNYDKMRKIYEYVAANFYYDTIAFANQSGQYINPYKNIYNYENNIASKNSRKGSDGKGKVATTCIGNAAMVMALARAQGIPARAVYGHALTSPWNTWGTETGIKTLDHWWTEAYVDGQWIVVDPTRGTNSQWNRSTNTWNRRVTGVLTYNYFDPSDQFLSNTHLYQGIK